MKELVVYGKPNCPNCNVAKNVLDSRDVPYTYVDVTEDDEAYVMLKNDGHKSVPQLYLDGTWIGNHMVTMQITKQTLED